MDEQKPGSARWRNGALHLILDRSKTLSIFIVIMTTRIDKNTATKAPAWPDDYADWHGSFDELVGTARQVLARQGTDRRCLPSPRIVRHYQAIGAVGRGVRRGREAVFGVDDLTRVVATKHLVKNGWRLDNASAALQAAAGLGGKDAVSGHDGLDAQAVVRDLMLGVRGGHAGAAAVANGAMAVAGLVSSSAGNAHAVFGTPALQGGQVKPASATPAVSVSQACVFAYAPGLHVSASHDWLANASAQSRHEAGLAIARWLNTASPPPTSTPGKETP